VARRPLSYVLAGVGASVLAALSLLVAPSPARATGTVSVADEALAYLRSLKASDPTAFQTLVYDTSIPESFTLGGKAVENWGDYAVFGSPEAYAKAARSGKAATWIKSGFMPKLSTMLTQVTVAAGGFAVGYKLGGWFVHLTGLVPDIPDPPPLSDFDVTGRRVTRLTYNSNPFGSPVINKTAWVQSVKVENLTSHNTSWYSATYDCSGGYHTVLGTPHSCSYPQYVISYLAIGVARDDTAYLSGDGSVTSSGLAWNDTGARAGFVTLAGDLDNEGEIDAAGPYTNQSYDASSGTTPNPATADKNAAMGAIAADDCLSGACQTKEQKAVTIWLVHEHDPNWTPTAPEQITTPDCVGKTVAECDALLDALQHSGARVYTATDLKGADITKPARTVLTQAVPAGTQVQADDELGFTRNPDDADMPIEMPAPYPHETYTHYLGRLQDEGYVGTAKQATAADADADPFRGPGEVIATTPAPATRLTKQTPVVVVVNPETAPDVTPDGTENAPPSDTNPLPPGEGAVGPIDFGPLQRLDFGCKFPFGFINCYALGVTGWFDVPTKAPEFDLRLACPTICDELRYDVNLDVMDPYMVIWRSLLSVVIWVGAIYYVASRFLGFGAGGDPGAAIDDAFTESAI
jgi:hypothetical protein